MSTITKEDVTRLCRDSYNRGLLDSLKSLRDSLYCMRFNMNQQEVEKIFMLDTVITLIRKNISIIEEKNDD